MNRPAPAGRSPVGGPARAFGRSPGRLTRRSRDVRTGREGRAFPTSPSPRIARCRTSCCPARRGPLRNGSLRGRTSARFSARRTEGSKEPATRLTSRLAWLDILGLFFDLDPPALARTHASTRRQVLLDSLFRKDAPRVTRRSGLAALASDRRHVLAVLADRPATLASRFPGLFRRKLVRGALLMRRP